MYETVTITQQTSQLLLHAPPHMERNDDRGSHRTHRPCHWQKTPVSAKIKSRQPVWKNILISRDALNAFRDAPTILMGKHIDPSTRLPISTQETVPVDRVKTMVAHVS